MLTAALQWTIDNHPWPDGAPIWAYSVCTLALLALATCVYIRSRPVG